MQIIRLYFSSALLVRKRTPKRHGRRYANCQHAVCSLGKFLTGVKKHVCVKKKSPKRKQGIDKHVITYRTNEG